MERAYELRKARNSLKNDQGLKFLLAESLSSQLIQNQECLSHLISRAEIISELIKKM